MIAPPLLSNQIAFDIPQALSAGNLSDQHSRKLTPSAVGAEFLPDMIDFGELFKFMSR